MLDEETVVILAGHQDLTTAALKYAIETVQHDHQRYDSVSSWSSQSIIAPGAMHQTRWMAKAIYGLKVLMFRSQLKLTMRETKVLRLLNLFLTFVYTKPWFRVPIVLQRSTQRLELLHEDSIFC